MRVELIEQVEQSEEEVGRAETRDTNRRVCFSKAGEKAGVSP